MRQDNPYQHWTCLVVRFKDKSIEWNTYITDVNELSFGNVEVVEVSSGFNSVNLIQNYVY